MTLDESLKLKKAFVMLGLFLVACLLLFRLLYLYLSDTSRYPVNTIKIVASYEHLDPSQLKTLLAHYQQDSFFMFPASQLHDQLRQMTWVDTVNIKRIFPDTIQVVIQEKHPIATWNGAFLTATGDTFTDPAALADTLSLPHLIGPSADQRIVLDTYQKINAYLAPHHVSIRVLQRRDNHAWSATLSNGIHLKFGKQHILAKALRFSRVFETLAESPTPIASVDLRYPKGIAVRFSAASTLATEIQTDAVHEKNP